MDLHVNLDQRRDLAGQIYRQVREAILDGRLGQGATLPPSRELARRLAVSRNTVAVAYDRLASEGYVAGRVGAGTYITGQAHPVRSLDAMPAGPLRPRQIWQLLPEPPNLTSQWRYDFRTGLPDARLFPYQIWRGLVARALRASTVGTGSYADPAGHPGLRAAIASHVGLSRGVRTTADDVFVTSGMQQAVDLVARVMLEPGSVVAVEDPGYPPAQQLLRSLGASVVGVPVDAEGLVIDAIPAQTQMVYVTPSHQYPMGMPMSLARRMALLTWADRNGGVIVEDDYDSEFRFAGRPMEPLQSLDVTGRVCYVGSFSKVMLPTLRLGFLIAPRSLREALGKAKFVTDWHTELPNQAALAEFITRGSLSTHIRRMRHIYRERHELIMDALQDRLSRWLTPIRCAAGLHVAALSDNLTDAQLAAASRQLRARSVAITRLSAYAVGTQPRVGLVFGYGSIDATNIPAGLAALLDCLTDAAPRAATGSANNASKTA